MVRSVGQVIVPNMGHVNRPFSKTWTRSSCLTWVISTGQVKKPNMGQVRHGDGDPCHTHVVLPNICLTWVIIPHVRQGVNRPYHIHIHIHIHIYIYISIYIIQIMLCSLYGNSNIFIIQIMLCSLYGHSNIMLCILYGN